MRRDFDYTDWPMVGLELEARALSLYARWFAWRNGCRFVRAGGLRCGVIILPNRERFSFGLQLPRLNRLNILEFPRQLKYLLQKARTK